MFRKILAETRSRIAKAAKQPNANIRKVALEFGVSRSTVRATAGGATRQGGNRSPVRTVRRLIQFREVPRFFCEPCKKMVGIWPCPACLAREARERGERSAAASLWDTDSDPPTEAVTCADDVHDWMPVAVQEWLRSELDWMIDAIANPEEVAGAAQELSGRIRRIVTVMAGNIGKQRRQLIGVCQPPSGGVAILCH
jgi:hypothetical protein